MKKILILITIIIILIMVIISIIKTISIKKESSKKLELTYEINAGIPFKWEVVIEDESIVKLDRVYVLKDENTGGKVGASVYRNYVFKGLKKGTTTVTFKYVNFTTNESFEEHKHTMKVDDDLNISLVAIPTE